MPRARRSSTHSSSRSDVKGSSKPWQPRRSSTSSSEAQVQGPWLHALPALRPSARGVSQVRSLPDLPARTRPRGRDPGHDQGQLVRRRFDMTMTDPIADMLTRLRNANTAMHDDVKMPSSKQKEAARGAPPQRATSVSTPSRTPGLPRAHPHDPAQVLARARACHLRHPAGVQARPAGVQQVHRGPPCPRRPRHLGAVDVPGSHDRPGGAQARIGGEILCKVW
jgi:small subunit ribosomal protein S8